MQLKQMISNIRWKPYLTQVGILALLFGVTAGAWGYLGTSLSAFPATESIVSLDAPGSQLAMSKAPNQNTENSRTASNEQSGEEFIVLTEWRYTAINRGGLSSPVPSKP